MKKHAASATALAVCSGICFMGLTASKMVNQKTLKLSLSTLAYFNPIFFRLILVLNDLKLLKIFGKTIEFFTVPGISAHFALRKKYIFDQMCIHLKGCEQCLILGGGFDYSVVRLASEFEHICFFETDHPATQKIKNEIINKSRLKLKNYFLIPIDYSSDNLADTLKEERRYDPHKKTLVIAEGLLMYLSEKEIFELFSVLRSFTSNESTLIMTSMILKNGSKRIQFFNQNPILSFWMKFKKEPFVWATSKEELEDNLSKKGCRLLQYIDHFELKTMYSYEANLAEGEVILVGALKKLGF